MFDGVKKKINFLTAVFVAFPLSLTACNHPITARPQVSAEEIRAEELYQEQLVAIAAERGGVPRPWRSRKRMRPEFFEVADRLEEPAAQICREMGIAKAGRRCYFYFDTKQSDDINASANGEYVYLNYGMLRFLQDENEVALITAHELAHNIMGHLDSQQNNAVAGAVVGLLLDGLAASQGFGTGGELASMGADAGALSYSVTFEEEADYVALYIAARAGYDISGAPDIWRRLSLEDPEGIYHSVTHPSNAARFVAMKKAIAEIQGKTAKGQPLVPEV